VRRFANTRPVSRHACLANGRRVRSKVAGWPDGRTTIETDRGFEAYGYHAVLSIEVTTSYANSAERPGDLVYVEVPRGGGVKGDGE
jgi:hypothetical protein